MKNKLISASNIALFIGSLAFADDVWVTNDYTPVSSSEFTWSSGSAPTSEDTWLLSSSDTLADAVYNVDSALEFAGLNISDVKNNTINILEGGSLALNSALTLGADSKLALALNGGSMSVGGAFTYQSANPLNVSNGSSLNVTNEFKFNNSSAVFSGAPTTAEYSLNLGGNLNLRPTSEGQTTSFTFENGAKAYVSGLLSLGSRENSYKNANTTFSVLSGSSVEFKGGTAELYAVNEGSSSKILVDGEGSSLTLANAIQITTRAEGTALNESAVLEVSNGAYFKSGNVEFWARADLSNKSEFILKNASKAEVAGILFQPNEGVNNVAGSAYLKVQDSGNTLKSSGSLSMTSQLNFDAVVSIEIDADNTVSFNGIDMRQRDNSARNAETGAFELGSRFLFNANEAGEVSTIGITNSAATITLESYIDLDFSNLVLGEGESVTSYLFMGYGVISGLSNENVYLTFDGKNYYALDADGKFANGDYSFELINEDSMLGYTLTHVVPEPSTYAAIFGAMSLAFAAYSRRRK